MAIKDVYKGLDKSLEETFAELKNKSGRIIAESAFDSLGGSESLRGYDFVKSSVGLESTKVDVTNKGYGIKEVVRHGFGKHGHLMSSFGCHPDFEDMSEDELRNGYCVTMFMDIIGSTKLGVIFPPEIVFKIKNDIIKCAIETVNAFDGHVHRIMGDAVMAFFRSNQHSINERIADSAVDALNCATYLIEMFRGVVIPKLAELGVDENLGIRIGIDYGAEEQVIWGKYGYMESHEVTATSFFVDVAAKLQQKAPKNSIMLGDSFVQLLGLDKEQLSIKEVIKNGESTPVKFVTPNYSDASGRPIDYRQYIFKNDMYYRLLPTNQNIGTLNLKASLKKSKEEISDDIYHPCSRVIKKGTGISFKGYYYSDQRYADPKFKFRVVNTGVEASKENNNGNHEAFEEAKYSEGRYFAAHWEDTAYTGLHHMYVSFWDGSRMITGEECFSLFVNE
ncbi:adenylate/guanylate cyclase domain-containing protein [Cronobacter sakazakii]